jgi:guanylate kinase
MAEAGRPGMAVIISGPSGSGKTTVVRQLLERRTEYIKSVSATTREKRPGEVDGKAYHFFAPEEFARLRDQGQLLEWSEHFGHCYGTPRQPVEAALAAGAIVILEIDVNGARQIKEKLPDSYGIFLRAPDMDELMARLRGRHTEDTEELQERLARAAMEMANRSKFDVEVINDDLARAVTEVENLIELQARRKNA